MLFNLFFVVKLGVGYKMAIDGGMTTYAFNRAKQHVLNVCSQGSSIILVGVSTKDEFGTITNESTLTLKSFPTRYNPYDREVSNEISWADNTDILCYISKLQIDNLSLTIQALRKKYKTFRHNNKTYEIRYIEPFNAFAGDCLYVIIGGKS